MFDLKELMREKFVPRVCEIHAPELAKYFKDEACIWTVRNLTGNEVAQAAEAVPMQKSIDTVIKSLSSEKDKIDAIRLALGLGDNVPPDIVRRLEMLVMGSVYPKIDKPGAIIINANFPVKFLELTNKILELTGLGADLKK